MRLKVWLRMNLKMRLKMWRAVAAALVILGIIWACDRAAGTYELRDVSDAIYGEDCLYFIDNRGDITNLFMTDMKGRRLGRIDVPKLQGTWWNSFSSLVRDRDGQVYVYCYSRAMDENKGRSLVYRCNFEQSSLELIWELPSVKMIQIQVFHGMVYYFAAADKDTSGFYRMDEQGNQELLRTVEGEISSVKDACYNPKYGLAWADWNGRFYFDGAEAVGEDIRDYVNIRMDQEGAYYMDAANGTVNLIPFDERKPVLLFRVEDVQLMEQGLDYMDVLPFHYSQDGTWLGGVDLNGERRVLGIFDEEGRQEGEVSAVGLKAGDRVNLWLKTACVCLVSGAALYWTMKLGLWWTKGAVPIIVKLLLILVPLIISASLLLNRQLRISLEERMLKMDYELMYVIADLELSGIRPEELMDMDLQKVPEDRYYRNIFEKKDYSELPARLYQYDSSQTQPVITSVYYWMFLEKDGILRYGQVEGRHYYGARVAYDRNREELKKMKKAMDSGTVVKTEYNDFTGDFIALYAPIVDSEGNSVGVMECGINRRILTYGVRQQMAQVHEMIIVIMALLIVILVGVLAFFLHPLARVKEAVEDVSQGNLGRRVEVRGRDEVANIGNAFNQMSGKLKEQMDFIQASMVGYAAFVPAKILEILEREDITRVRLGDQKEIEAAVLNIGSLQFREEARSLSSDEMYRMINQMLHEMIPVIGRDEGVVDHMNADGVEAYYPENCEGALKSAVSVCERFRILREEGMRIPLYRCSLVFGNMKLGIVGGSERMEASSISELKSLADCLITMGEKYGARIILLESVAARISDFKERYHVREIGTLYHRRSGKVERIFDVYDGDDADEFAAKERTKALFCNAMKAYRNGRYYDARLLLVRLLKENGGDLAARTYVYRCDTYYQTGDKKAVPAHLEAY